MKLIIDIPDEAYNRLLTEQHLPNRLDIEYFIVHGIPLDKIRAEISENIEVFRMSDWETNNILADGLQMALNIIDGYREGEEE